MTTIEGAREIIETALLSDDGGFAPRGFEFACTIFRARLAGSFVAALINGAEEEISFWAQAGRHRHSELLRWLGQLTGHEPAFWFYICDVPGGKSAISWVKTARHEPGGDFLNVPLAQFEIEPAAIGGSAYLGLMGEAGKWLLLHTHYAEQEFEISIHGATKLCNDLCRLVKSIGVEPEWAELEPE